jgi:hypothetical protein
MRDYTAAELQRLQKLQLVELCVRKGVFADKRVPRAYAMKVPTEALREAILRHQAKGNPQLTPRPGMDWNNPYNDNPPPVGMGRNEAPPIDHRDPFAPAPEPVNVEPVKVAEGQEINLQELAEKVAPLIPTPGLDENRVKELIAAATIAVQRVELERVVDGEKVIVDAGLQHKLFPIVAKVLASTDPRMNLWIAGPAGSGKTKSLEILAKVGGYRFIRIPCGDQTLASLFMGFVGATGVYTPGLIWHAVEAAKAGEKVLVLWDEFDRMQPGVATQANALLDGSPVTFPNGETIILAEYGIRQFVSANTFARPTLEHPTVKAGDGSTVNRFAKLEWFFDEGFETALYAELGEWVTFVQRVRAAAKAAGIRNFCLSFRTHDQYRELRNLGISHELAERMTIWTGLPDDDVAKLEGALGIKVPSKWVIE